jgi:hypothetical protein
MAEAQRLLCAQSHGGRAAVCDLKTRAPSLHLGGVGTSIHPSWPVTKILSQANVCFQLGALWVWALSGTLCPGNRRLVSSLSRFFLPGMDGDPSD